MKANEWKEYKDKSVSELGDSLKDKKVELFNLRFQLATGQLQNSAQLSAVKRDIARVKTLLRQRQDEIKA